LSCGKHFPGHGFAEADSHVAIPVDERPLKQIMSDDRELQKKLMDTSTKEKGDLKPQRDW
jgi:beta-glucosidase-like glycosyl hydrolase